MGMGLNRYKIGDLISVVDERNTEGIRDFYGVNINKEFMPTAANTDGLNEKKYKVIRKERFVFSGMQTGRDECIRISMYMDGNPIIVSPAYTTFEVTAADKVVPLYFFMVFLSKEKDRLGWFYSDSSIRANLDWERFCDIELDLPPLSVQRKYVAIYRAMLENQKSYERGLEDLKLAADALLERFKYGTQRIPLGQLVKESDQRNVDGTFRTVEGVNKDKLFMPSVANGADLTKYKTVQTGQFACNLMHVGRDKAVPVALQMEEDGFIVSPAYLVFSIDDERVLPQYVLMWLSRQETDRYAWFMSDTNVRSGMEKKRFYEIDIPVPEISLQQSLVEIYEALSSRQKINEKLKSQIKSLCPILIKGSLEEGQREAAI